VFTIVPAAPKEVNIPYFWRSCLYHAM